MLEDTELHQFCLEPIDPEYVVDAEKGEIAYGLREIFHGTISNPSEEYDRLKAITPVSANTLGFELECDCDFFPFDLKTFTADKIENARYSFGDHAPGEDRYQEPCRFKPGEKVLCLIYEGFYAVFPAIVLGPLSEDYLRKLYESDKENCLAGDADDFVDGWVDWNWDSVIVQPLVRLKSMTGHIMPDSEIINRVYVFPYKKYKV